MEVMKSNNISTNITNITTAGGIPDRYANDTLQPYTSLWVEKYCDKTTHTGSITTTTPTPAHAYPLHMVLANDIRETKPVEGSREGSRDLIVINSSSANIDSNSPNRNRNSELNEY